ncbi:hypothetical protein F5Y17DRAFT_12457 [Xylariaceae sp. FL0594]|nr:hypothetical protein F5Y17DRAFT_12457 [Xylariaceae sp. FL0594]
MTLTSLKKLLGTAAFLLLVLGVNAGGCNHGYCERTPSLSLKRDTTSFPPFMEKKNKKKRQSSPTTTYIPNGDFESGLAPWTVQVPDAAAQNFSVSSPGALSSSGHSFFASFVPPSVNTERGVSIRLVSAPVLVTVPGVPYELAFYSYFDNPRAGFVGVKINDVPVYTVDATDYGWGPAVGFVRNALAYTPPPSTQTVTVKFEFLFGESNGVASLDRIDGVTFAPA